MVWQRDKGKHKPLRHQTGATLTSHHEEATKVPGASGLGLSLTDEFQILKVLLGRSNGCQGLLFIKGTEVHRFGVP